jgi:hypothetical protein
MTDPKSTAKTSDEAKEKPGAKAPAKKEPAKPVLVICAVSTGRRRAGRRWDAGETQVAPEEFTDEMRAALAADPLFQVIEPAQAD